MAITFTERAARKCATASAPPAASRLLECPEEQADYWLELIRDLDSAADQHDPLVLRLAAAVARRRGRHRPAVPRARRRQAGTLLFELIDDVLRDRLAERDEATLALVTRFGLDRLRDMIARLLAVRQEIDWPPWRGETPEGLVARWEEFWRSDTVPRLLRRIGESAAAQTVLDLAMRYPPAIPRCASGATSCCEQLPQARGARRLHAEQPALHDLAGDPRGGQGARRRNEEALGQRGGLRALPDAAKALRDAIDER